MLRDATQDGPPWHALGLRTTRVTYNPTTTAITFGSHTVGYRDITCRMQHQLPFCCAGVLPTYQHGAAPPPAPVVAVTVSFTGPALLALPIQLPYRCWQHLGYKLPHGMPPMDSGSAPHCWRLGPTSSYAHGSPRCPHCQPMLDACEFNHAVLASGLDMMPRRINCNKLTAFGLPCRNLAACASPLWIVWHHHGNLIRWTAVTVGQHRATCGLPA